MHSPKQLQVIHFGNTGSRRNSLSGGMEIESNNPEYLFGHDTFGQIPMQYVQQDGVRRNGQINESVIHSKVKGNVTRSKDQKSEQAQDEGAEEEDDEEDEAEEQLEEEEEEDEEEDNDNDDEEYTEARASNNTIRAKSTSVATKHGKSAVSNKKSKKQISANRKPSSHTSPANMSVMDPTKRYCKYRQYGCNHRGFLIKQTSKCIERHETCCSKRFYEPVRQYRAHQFNHRAETDEQARTGVPSSSSASSSSAQLQIGLNASSLNSSAHTTSSSNTVHGNKGRGGRSAAQSAGPCRNTRSRSKGPIDSSDMNKSHPPDQGLSISDVDADAVSGVDMLRALQITPVGDTNLATRNMSFLGVKSNGEDVSLGASKTPRTTLSGHIRKFDESSHTLISRQNPSKKNMTQKAKTISTAAVAETRTTQSAASTSSIPLACSAAIHPANPITDAVRGRNISSPHIDSLHTNVDAILKKIETSYDSLSSQRDNSVQKKNEFTTVAQNYIQLLSVNPAKLAHQKQQIMSQLKNKFERSFEKSTLATTQYFELQKKQYECATAAARQTSSPDHKR